MPRKKRKYEEHITLGFTDAGTRIRKYIGADSKQEFERMKKAAIIEAEKIRRPSEISIGDYADQWIAIYKVNTASQTRAGYQYSIDKLLPIRHKPLKDVTTSDLQALINKHAVHPRSCQLLKLTLKQIYKQAIKDGIIYPVNLAEDLTIPKYVCKERRFLSDAELKKIDKCKFTEQDGRYVAMLRNTGMRPSEALALQWSDIDVKNLTITVSRSFEFPNGNTPVIKPTKTYRNRTIPITAEYAATLSQTSRSGLFVFTCKDGSPVSKSSYKRMSGRILAEINRVLGGSSNLSVLDGITLYSFRHTYATGLYYKAVKPGIISCKKAAQIMGHSEEMFIRRYTHLNDEHEQMDALRDVLSAKKGRQKGDTTTRKSARETRGRQENEVKIG